MPPKNATAPTKLTEALKKAKQMKQDKATIANNNAATSKQWWSSQDTEQMLLNLNDLKERNTALPNGSGNMITFQDQISVKLQDCRLMSEVDDNNKLCLSLDDEQFHFFHLLSETLNKSLIARLKMMHPKHAEAEFWPSIKISEQTGNKYLKTKVQLLGASRTMGCDVDGTVSNNVPTTLSTVGAMLDVRIRVDGVYLTKEKCGIITKVDIFKVKGMPSDEDVEQERETKRRRMDETRMGELLNNF